jgi:ABC-type multidrug transport system fused ATPase/permease subunit
MVLAPAAVYWITGISPWATLFVMFIIISLTVVLATRQSRFFTRFKQLAAERTGIVNEWVQTIRLLRILGWVESFETKIFNKRREETKNRVAMVTNGQLMNAFGSSINFVINLVGAASLIFFSQREVTPGELFALLWIFGIFMARSFRQLPWFFTFILDSLTSMRRLEAFMARPSDAGEVTDSPTSTPVLVAAHGESLGLSIRGLNLSIRDQKILEDINLDIRTGEFVAIVGEVGAGKSMFVLSLVGETGATFDSFKIGGRDVLNLSLDQRRRYFAFVPQEGFVMSASLRENIVFRYEPEASEDAEIERSLELAQFRLSEVQGNGLETEIGERGVNLSGGQRQRVSLARAHHFERPLVLLDDCLSAVDVDTERKLLDSLIDGAWREKTRLLITHRLSVLNKVDRIIFLENGRIHDMGTLQELMKRSTKMQEFVASVKKHEAEAASGKEAANGIAQSQPEPIS